MAEEKYAEEVARKELFRWLEAVGGEIPEELYTVPVFDENGNDIRQKSKWEHLTDMSKSVVSAIRNGSLTVSDDGSSITFVPSRSKWVGSPIVFHEPNGGVLLAFDKDKGNIGKNAAAICRWGNITDSQFHSLKFKDAEVLISLMMTFQVVAN